MQQPNTLLFQQLFAGEDVYLISDEKNLEVAESTENAPKIPQTEVKIEPIVIEKEVVADLPVQVVEQTPLYVPDQKVLVLVNTITDSEKVFLNKILGAINLDLSNVNLLILSELDNKNLKSILQQNLLTQLVTFGVPLVKINIEILLTPYQIREVEGVKLLYSDALSEIENDIPKKKALWNALKSMVV
jgi:DNA polymerase III psi subunit